MLMLCSVFQACSKRDSTRATLDTSEGATPAKIARMSEADDSL